MRYSASGVWLAARIDPKRISCHTGHRKAANRSSQRHQTFQPRFVAALPCEKFARYDHASVLARISQAGISFLSHAPSGLRAAFAQNRPDRARQSCCSQRSAACRQNSRSSAFGAWLSSSRHSSICFLKNSCLSNDTTDPVDRKRPSPPRRPLAKIPRFPLCLAGPLIPNGETIKSLRSIVCRQGPISGTRSNCLECCK